MWSYFYSCVIILLGQFNFSFCVANDKTIIVYKKLINTTNCHDYNTVLEESHY